jgi:hypothetical protein
MMKAAAPALLLCAGLPLAAQPAIDLVLQSELAFARLAEQKGIRAAFLAWLEADARVFTPRTTAAKDRYGPGPGDPGHLAWYPEAMGLAQSGDLAWSFGPWTYAPKQGEPVLVHGHFLSIWRRGSAGWKVMADIGLPHAAPVRPAEPFAPWDSLATRGKAPGKPLEAEALLRQKEAALSAAWALQGGRALLGELARGAQILRPRAFPARTQEEIQVLLAGDLPGATWELDRLQVAASGDLAWTCGESGPPEAASFLRVWVREGGAWKVRFDVRLRHPAPKP